MTATETAADITPAQLADLLDVLCAEVSAKSQAYVHISGGQRYGSKSPPINGVIQPEGVLGKVALRISCHMLSEVEPALRAAWDEHSDLHASNTIKGMALAIIRLTAELGECTDGALRCDFTQQEINRHGDAAADLATEMGGNGPFKIVRVASNMAEAA